MAQADLLHLISSKMDHFQWHKLIWSFRIMTIFNAILHPCHSFMKPNRKNRKNRKKTKKPRSLIEWWPHTYFPARLGFFRFFSFFFSVFSVWLQEFYNSPGHCEVSAKYDLVIPQFNVSAKHLSGNRWIPCVCYILVWRWKANWTC